MPRSFTPEYHRRVGPGSIGWEKIPGMDSASCAVLVEERRILDAGGAIYQTPMASTLEARHPADDMFRGVAVFLVWAVLFLSSAIGPIYAMLFYSTYVLLREIRHRMQGGEFDKEEHVPIWAAIGLSALLLEMLRELGLDRHSP